MKLKLLLSLLSVFILNQAFAQDVIIKQNGEEIQARILEVNSDQIKYKRFDNQEGPQYTINVKEVLLIKFENGSKEIFAPAQQESVSKKVMSNDMVMQGRQDSRVYYRGQNSGAGWVVATTILFTPLVGLLPTIGISSSAPLDQNLNYPDHTLMSDPGYYSAYVKESHKTKKRKIWTTYGVTSGAWLVLFLIL